jgi:hypothetical protein
VDHPFNEGLFACYNAAVSLPPSTHDVNDPYPSVAGLKEIAGLAALCAITFYAAGLIVSNVYLASIGIVDYGLLKARCIMTGAWASLIVFLSCMPSLVLHRMMLAPPDHELRKGRWFEMWRVFSLCFVLVAALISVLSGNPLPSINEFIDFTIFTLILAVPIVLDAVFKLTARKHLPEGMASRLRDAQIRTTILGLVCCMGVLFLISALFYPHILPAWGGGKPQTAKLILNHEGLAVWKKLPFGIDYDALAKKSGAISSEAPSDPFVTDEVEVLYETDNQLVIQLKPEDKHTVATLDRKLISSIIPITK